MKSAVCIDANLALALVFKDERHHKEARNLFQQFGVDNVTLCAPAMFAYEFDSVVRLRIYKGEITLTQAEEARAFLNGLGVVIVYDGVDRDRAFEIAHQYDQPRAYDATYAAHAEARGLDLFTFDQPFFEAVNGSKRPKNVAPLTFVKLVK